MGQGIEIKNAIIESATIDTERGLMAWIQLDYGGCCQGFGGYLLYFPKEWKAPECKANYAGHFLYRVIQIAGVSEWGQLKGKCVRAHIENGMIKGIGHIIKDDWFFPEEDFKGLNYCGSGRR